MFDGADVTALRAHKRVARGIALVPEGRRLFASMTVEENLQVAMRVGRRGQARQSCHCDSSYKQSPHVCAPRTSKADSIGI